MRTPPDLRPAAPASFRRKVAIPDTAWPSHLGRRKIHRHRTRDASQDNAHIYPGRWRVERRRRARSDPVARRFQWQNVLVTSLGARATPRPPAGPGTLPIGVIGVTDAIGLTAVPAAPCRAVPGRARGSRRDDPGGRDRGARGAAGAAAGGRPGGWAWPNHGLAGRVVPGRRRWAEAAGRAGDAFEEVVVAARFRRGRVGGCEPGHSCPREWSTVRWPSASADVRRWHSMALDGTRCQAISGDIRRYQAMSLDVTRHHSTSARRPRRLSARRPGWAISRTGHGAEVDQGVAFDRSYVIVVTSFIHRMKYSRHRCLRDVVSRHQSALPKLVTIQALSAPNTTAL